MDLFSRLARGFGYLTLDPSPRLRKLREAPERNRRVLAWPRPLPPLPASAYGPDAVPLDCSGIPTPSCPECGGPVIYDLTCHTYGQGDRFYACMPCDSAVEYICATQYEDEPGSCQWRYTHGLNRANPRAVENEKHRPPWLPAGQACGEWRAPGVRMIGS